MDIEKAGAEWGVSSKTVNKVFASLGAAYKHAKSKLGVKNNPVLDVEKAKDQTTPEEIEALALGEIEDRGEDHPEEKAGTLRAIGADEVYSAAELKRIIDHAKPGYERAFLLTAILTGLRHGEQSGLRWKGDLKKGMVVDLK